MANYYRAVPAVAVTQATDPSDRAPTLISGARRKRYYAATLRISTSGPKLTLVKIARAGHFVQTDQPERVNEELLKFLR